MEKKLTIRLTDSDYKRLVNFANGKQISIAAAVRLILDKIK